MNLLKTFTYNSSAIRIVHQNGEPWFVLKDVCAVLAIENSRDVAARLDDEEKGVDSIDTQGGQQEVTVISESGLYNVIFLSRKPEAKTFKRWVTHEVLPSIRKHGAYMTPETLEAAILNPDTIIRICTALKEEQSKNATLSEKVKADKPKVLFADAVDASRSSILVGDLAKLIRQNGIDIGQNRLFEWLRNNSYLIKGGSSKNMPTQRSMDICLFEVKETTIVNPDGSIRISKTTKVTGKGQQHFISMFLGTHEEEKICANFPS